MNKIKGITDEQITIIKDIIKDYPKIKFWLYGSRVNGNFSRNSDLDVLAKGNAELSYDLLEEMRLKFDQSNLPFIVHISDYHKLEKSFFNLIKNSMEEVC